MRRLHIKLILGFTIIEYVIVILLIGILGAFVMARFNTNNSFNGIVVRDQLISMTRLAQQASFGRSNVSMVVTPNAGGSELTLTVADSGGVFETASVAMSGLTLEADINDTDSCTVDSADDAITSGTPLTINFDGLGVLGTSGVTGSTGAITSAVRICVNDDVDFSVCVSPAGFAYAGNCDVD